MADDPVLFDGYDDLVSSVGRELGVSPWLTVGQSRIDGFAECTGDHAWIHVDPERAASGPFGGTIAHGPLTLSLVTVLAGQVFRVGGLRLALHYGYDRVRFISPVPSGSAVRARVTLTGVEGDPEGARAHYQVVVERDDEQIACAVDLIYFYVFEPSAAAHTLERRSTP